MTRPLPKSAVRAARFPAGRPRAANRPPGNRRRENETRILKAAEEVFASAGFSGARTAAIARRAGVPKANLHYYFGTKERLYRRVLENILEVWLALGDSIRPEADPAAALAAYVAAKVAHSRRRPQASKVFANELLHGAPQIQGYLRNELRRWVDGKAAVIEGWIAAGRMAPVPPRHLFFVIWAMTQTYADFDVQVAAVLGRRRIPPSDYEAARALITRLILRGAGLDLAADAGRASLRESMPRQKVGSEVYVRRDRDER
jgi:TetR/AcrR family transcriptional regulator